MLFVTFTDRWTGRHGVAVEWRSRRLEAAVELGFGNGWRSLWRRSRPVD